MYRFCGCGRGQSASRPKVVLLNRTSRGHSNDQRSGPDLPSILFPLHIAAPHPRPGEVGQNDRASQTLSAEQIHCRLSATHRLRYFENVEACINFLSL